ncbi:MAG: glycosyltransferase family protein [Pirellulaceae bacterium]|nr:glycosyltransferase family protein [Pirellulaceae bacterium]
MGQKLTRRTIVIVQARVSSTRLPGKVLKKLAGRSILHHVLSRCQQISFADSVLCATTELPSDDAVVQLVEEMGIDVFRGSERDVLARYHDAACSTHAEIIMRVTSDCPLIDPALCDAVLQLQRSEKAEYATNNMPPTWPHGLDCEAFTMEALEAAHLNAMEPHDREHVTPWIRRAEQFRRVNLPRTGRSRYDLRWSLDYPEDLTFFEAFFDRFPDFGHIPDTETLIALMDAHPEIGEINRGRAITA